MTNETESAGVEVTQADREAAAALVRWQRQATEQWQTKEGSALQFFVADFSRAIVQGIWDEHPVVQAFARHRTTAEAGKRELVEALRPFAEEAQRWEPRGGAHWPDAVPFPANSFSTIRIGDLRQARATLAKHGGPA